MFGRSYSEWNSGSSSLSPVGSLVCLFARRILAHIPVVLSTLLPASLRTFYDLLLKITDLNPFAAFGLSCANHALRSFETRLLVALVAPLVVSIVLIAFTLVQVHVLRRDSATCFSRYAQLQRIVLFLVLPVVSATIFRT